jgi:hypothetical protein
MQKGSLDIEDYAWLVILVLAYIALRPYTQKALKWLLAPKDIDEGRQAQEEYFQSKAKVGANAIRGSKMDEPQTISLETGEVTASGSNLDKSGQAVNRRAKDTNLGKSEEDKLVDWDDEPARGHVEGDKSDVVAWLDKWDK